MQTIIKENWFKVINKIVDKIYEKSEKSEKSSADVFSGIEKQLTFMSIVEMTKNEESTIKEDLEKGYMPCLVYIKTKLDVEFVMFFDSIYSTIIDIISKNKTKDLVIHRSLINRMKILFSIFMLAEEGWNTEMHLNIMKNLCLFDIDNAVREENENTMLEQIKIHS